MGFRPVVYLSLFGLVWILVIIPWMDERSGSKVGVHVGLCQDIFCSCLKFDCLPVKAASGWLICLLDGISADGLLRYDFFSLHVFGVLGVCG